MSTKGQIVIPENLRENLEVGTPFVVTRKDNLIILKNVGGLTHEEIEEMKELGKIWGEVEAGEAVTLDKEEFLKEMNAW